MPLDPARVYRRLLYGTAALLVGWLGLRALTAASDDGCTRYCQALIASKTHARLAAEQHADSLVARALTKKVVYVVARRKATDAVEALPPATIAGTEITLPQGTFPIALPVKEYIVALQQVVAVQDTALTTADSALAASEQARAASDSAAAARHAEDVAKLDAAESGQPGRLARAWNAVKAPVAFIGGAVVGVVVGRVVVR